MTTSEDQRRTDRREATPSLMLLLLLLLLMMIVDCDDVASRNLLLLCSEWRLQHGQECASMRTHLLQRHLATDTRINARSTQPSVPVVNKKLR